MLTINNVPTQAGYAEALTLGPTATAQKVAYLVANAAAIVQLAGYSEDKTIQPWSDEILITPTTGEFQRIQGMRFKDAVPGTHAQIVAQLVEPGDPVPVGGTPFTSVLTPTGAITPVSAITRVTALPASPTDGQLVSYDLTSQGWPGFEWLCIYNASSGYWDVFGTPELNKFSGVGIGLASGAWTELMSLVVPNAGDYYVGTYGIGWGSGAINQLFQTGVSVNGAVPGAGMTSGVSEAYASGADIVSAGQVSPTPLSLTLGQRASLMGFCNGAGANTLGEFMFVKPVRIK